jgi:hypothetical protein
MCGSDDGLAHYGASEQIPPKVEDFGDTDVLARGSVRRHVSREIAFPFHGLHQFLSLVCECGCANLLARVKQSGKRTAGEEGRDVPDTIRFLLIIACLAGAVYGAVWALANYPPEQTQIVRPLPHEKIRQQ